jgi:hypothetical protein
MQNGPRNPQPYHQMTLEEYATTPHAQTVPRWSILALPTVTYSVTQLCRYGTEALRALAFVWRVRQDGTKHELAERIIARAQFRSQLATESQASLAKRPRKELLELAKEAGIYHPWLNRNGIAASLIQWREDSRRHAAMEIARARHEQLVQSAARKNLFVPSENLSRYGLDRNGEFENTIFGVPVSRALQFAPEAIAAARSLSLINFLAWVKENSVPASKLVFIEPGILGDGGQLFWKLVQKAFAAPDVPPLFAALADSEDKLATGMTALSTGS